MVTAATVVASAAVAVAVTNEDDHSRDGDFIGFASSEVDGPSMAQQIDKPIAEDDEFQAF